RISPAALLVKVRARIDSGATPYSSIRFAIREVRTRVFPEPAPASTRRGPSKCSAATRCSGFSRSRYDKLDSDDGRSGMVDYGKLDHECGALAGRIEGEPAPMDILNDAAGE